MRATISIGVVEPEEVRPGTWVDKTTEIPLAATILRNSSSYQGNQLSVNDTVRLNHRMSVRFSETLLGLSPAVRYVVWRASKWKVTNIDIERPNMILTLGGPYA